MTVNAEVIFILIENHGSLKKVFFYFFAASLPLDRSNCKKTVLFDKILGISLRWVLILSYSCSPESNAGNCGKNCGN